MNKSYSLFPASNSVKQRVFTRLNGICSNTIILNADYTYCNEGGCESSSNINLGNWYQIKDSIILTQIDRKTFNPAKHIKIYGHNDSNTVFIIKDKYDLPVQRFIVAGYPKNNYFKLDNQAKVTLINIPQNITELEKEEATNNVYYKFIAKEVKTSVFSISKKGIEFYDILLFSEITNKPYILKCKDLLGDTIEIKLAFNKEATAYGVAKWSDKEQSMRFLLKDSTLSKDDYILKEKIE